MKPTSIVVSALLSASVTLMAQPETPAQQSNETKAPVTTAPSVQQTTPKPQAPKLIRTNKLEEALANPTLVARLDLSRKQLTEVPADVSKFVNLEELILRGNKLTSLPVGLSACTKLRSIDISDNLFTTIPPVLQEIKALRRLLANNNQFVTIDDNTFAGMTALEEISLVKTGISKVPTSITSSINLKTLIISANALNSLPDQIGNIKQLRKLDASQNSIKSLPASLSGIQTLEEIDLSQNQLSSLPADLLKLPALKTVKLNKNAISQLPADITSASLRFLEIDENGLTSIPTGIKGLSKLEKLSIAGNKLTNLPKEIALCTQLTSLDVSGNQLKDLPIAELAEMERLSTLKISNKAGMKKPQQNVSPMQKQVPTNTKNVPVGNKPATETQQAVPKTTKKP